MDSNISSTLTTSSRTQLWINSNVAGSKILQDIISAPRESYRRPSFEGQGYSHPMEGDSRSLRQLHDSSNSSEDLELSLFRPSPQHIMRNLFFINLLNKHACTMKHLPNPTRANKRFSPTSRRVWNLSKFSRYTTLPPRPLESNPPTPSRNMLRRYSTAVRDSVYRRTQPNARQRHGSFDDGMIEQDDHNGVRELHS
jgi:hypothetical protein